MILIRWRSSDEKSGPGGGAIIGGSHAEAITALGVEAVIEHDDRVLLIAEPGPDFTDDTWQLPGGPVLPGQTLTDALHPAVAAIGLTIDEITGYLGHHDHPGAHATTRVFCFTVTVTDPEAICRASMHGHRWADGWDRREAGGAGLYQRQRWQEDRCCREAICGRPGPNPELRGADSARSGAPKIDVENFLSS